MRRALSVIAGLLLLGIAAGATAEEARLLRFPAINKDKIAFVYGGDIWTVPTAGGQARKLTNSEGLELFPKFSPDGKQIAFTGQYDGDQNVYVMPAEGGVPKRLSYHPAIRQTSERMGPESIVMGWTPDGSKILYRSREATYSVWEGKLYLVSPAGGYPQELALPRGGFASYSADGSKIAYTPIFRDFRTWKRYKGGTAQDVWIYDLKNAKSEKITDWVGTDNMPMWDPASGKIFFNSDRTPTGRLNLFSYDPATKQTAQVTDFTEYDVRWPSLGPGAIILENGGYLYVLDLPNGKPRKINVELGSDRILARPKFVSCGDRVQDFSVSPDTKRALFGARGEIFTVPAKHGNTRNITNTPDAHEKHSTFSPDGKWVAYISDASGEDEVYILDPSGNGKPVRLTTDGHCYRYGPVWSPDSKKLVWSDKDTRLHWVDIDSKKQMEIDYSNAGDIRYYSWSPDSRWIGYYKNNAAGITQIYLYSTEENKSHVVTSGEFNDYDPVFDLKGKYLYFFSDRTFNPILGNYEFDFVLNKMTNIVAVTLDADTMSPFAPQSDEIKVSGGEAEADKGEKKEDKKKGDKTEAAKTPRTNIAFDGILNRQVKFPIPAGNYGGLSATEGQVFYLSSPMGGLGGPVESGKQSLHVFDMEKREDHEFLGEADAYELTPDGKKMIYKKGGMYEIIDASGEKARTGEGVLDLSKMEARVDQAAEWRQIFEEAWRIERDFFYDSLMHGVNWKKIHDLYAPLVPYVAHRFDLTYIIGEMIGELACSHTYTGGGDQPHMESDKVGLLGVDWAIDSSAGLFRIGRIMQGQNWREDRRSPLTEPGIKAAVGDYVLEINGTPLKSSDNPYRLLENTAGEIVTLKLSKTPSASGSWNVDVKTIASEEELRYHNWTEHNYRYVDSASGGRIGYLQIPDMGGPGLEEFTSTYYAQIRKEGLIIDVRYNGGGFVSQVILERLRRVLVGMGSARNWSDPGTYPGTVFSGYMACLMNEHSCSDGDIFPWFFREYGLGPLIGKRTWGGVVGIRGFRPFTDGGYITASEFAQYDLKGKWQIENHGVDPDIDVDNLPEVLIKGRDQQLDRAIAELTKKISEAPKKLPMPVGPPDKR